MKIYQLEREDSIESNILLPFKEIYALENGTLTQEALMTNQILANAIEGDGNLNIDKVEMIAKYNANLNLSQTIDKLIIQSYSPVKQVVDRINSLCENALDILLSKQQRSLIRKTIFDVFTNLYSQKQASWIFYQACSPRVTTYKYNLIFAIQNALTKYSIQFLTMSLMVNIYRSSENILQLKPNDNISCSIKINCLKLTQSFPAMMN